MYYFDHSNEIVPNLQRFNDDRDSQLYNSYQIYAATFEFINVVTIFIDQKSSFQRFTSFLLAWHYGTQLRAELRTAFLVWTLLFPILIFSETNGIFLPKSKRILIQTQIGPQQLPHNWLIENSAGEDN